MADVDAALVQQVFDVAERQREPDVHHDRQADDFGRGLEVPERGTLGHPGRLASQVGSLKEFALTGSMPELPL